MLKNKFTEYGKSIKRRILELDRTQAWLIDEVNKRANITMTSSYLNRIMIGKVAKSSAIPIINEILGIESEERAAEDVSPCTDWKTASAGMNPTTADAVPLPLTREALAGASPALQRT